MYHLTVLLVVQNASCACTEDEWTLNKFGGAETLSSKNALLRLDECPVCLQRGSYESTFLLYRTTLFERIYGFDSTLIEKPSASSVANVPSRATGTTMVGMMV